MILLSCNWLNKIKFDLYSKTKATFFNSILVLFIKVICTIFTFLDHMIYLSIIVKSYIFGQVFLIKKLQLFVKYWDIQKSKYHIDFDLNIIIDFAIIKALSK